MSDEYIITNLSNTLGYLLEDITHFLGNIFTGWFLMLGLMTVAIVVMLYFRFFKNTSRWLT